MMVKWLVSRLVNYWLEIVTLIIIAIITLINASLGIMLFIGLISGTVTVIIISKIVGEFRADKHMVIVLIVLIVELVLWLIFG